MQTHRKLRWFILARIIVLVVLQISTLVLREKAPGDIEGWPVDALNRLVGLGYIFSFLSLAALRFKKTHRSLAYLQIVWDLSLITLLLLLTGGISSPFSFFYLLSIVSSSVILARKEALYAASLCAILYGSILDLQFYGYLAPLGLSQSLAYMYGAPYIFYTIFLNIGAFYLTALLTGYLAEDAQRSQRAFAEKVVDFDELEKLNARIVSGMNSGLLTLNDQGRIRVFNAAAEKISGFKQKDVYDRSLVDILPELAIARPHKRGEVVVNIPAVGRKVIGYSTVALHDSDGRYQGLVVNFQDVTALKQLEADLKRADRLAAIGELAASMAHEIRNPLAAISGSVQLLRGGGMVDPADRKLLDIVVRESDRLNKLITEFLAYARPRLPQRIKIHFQRLLHDLQALVERDSKFAKIRMDVSVVPEDLMLEVDADQFRQILWNLAINAAEAMGGEGAISVSASGAASGSGVHATIVFADTGCGIMEKDMSRVFEPFFTTKDGGTGLGLATVYQVIKAHEFAIAVESAPGRGTVFTITVPQSSVRSA